MLTVTIIRCGMWLQVDMERRIRTRSRGRGRKATGTGSAGKTKVSIQEEMSAAYKKYKAEQAAKQNNKPKAKKPTSKKSQGNKNDETDATATGKAVHKRNADKRRASGEYDSVNQRMKDSNGDDIKVSKTVNKKTKEKSKKTQAVMPDAVKGPDKGGVIIDDKPAGRSISKDYQEIRRFVEAYEKKYGVLPNEIIIERYDPDTGEHVGTEHYPPSMFKSLEMYEMLYEVLDCYNTVVKVKDQDIEEWIRSGTDIRIEIVMAMGRTHNEKYLPYLYPALYEEDFDMKREAAQSIVNLNGNRGLNELKKKDALLDESDLEKIPSEKGILMAMILRIEKGIKGVKEYFLSNNGFEIVKYDSIVYYRPGFPFVEEDVEFLCFALEAFIENEHLWIKKLSRTDYESFIYFALEGIWTAGESINITSNTQDYIYRIIERLLREKLNNDTKEVIASISIYVDKVHAKKY